MVGLLIYGSRFLWRLMGGIQMIQELIKAFTLIFIAEMGDKTQILAMAFATKYSVKKVLLGIFIGAFLNHGLAVLLGKYISTVIPVNTVQIIAGFAFVAFALWTLRPDDEEHEEENSKYQFGPVLTVAIAFFIGELGDKTQLSVITLSTDAAYPIFTLGGSVLGMIVTGGLGIVIGKKLGDKIPDLALKIAASAVFMFFGITKLYQTVPEKYLSVQNIALFVGIILIIAVVMILLLIKQRQEGRQSAFIKMSKRLYDYYNAVHQNLENMCLGAEKCGECEGNHCVVGYTKSLIQYGLNHDESLNMNLSEIKETHADKTFDKELALDSLAITLLLVKDNPKKSEYKNIHEIRKKLETILLGKSIEQMDNWSVYIKTLSRINKDVAKNVLECMNSH